MKDKAGKLLVVESDDALREHIVTVLRDAGYEVSTHYFEGMKTVLAFNPDAVVLGADPAKLDCCNFLSEIKGSERTQNIRVLTLSPERSAERTRRLDLGADEVLSLPFDPHELLSRVRSQMRNKYIEDEFRERRRIAEENRIATQQVVTAIDEERRTLRRGNILTVVGLIVSGLVFLVSYHHTQEQNARVYTAITRLQTGVLTQQQLMERSRRALEDWERGRSLASDPQKVQLKKKSEDLRAQIAIKQTEDTSALQNQLGKAARGDVFALAKIAGHSSITITQKYVHPEADTIDEVFSRLGSEKENKGTRDGKRKRVPTKVPTVKRKAAKLLTAGSSK
jgi:DNA-binding response OmpR family regulator